MKFVLALAACIGIWYAAIHYDSNIPRFLPAGMAHAILVYKADRGDTAAMIELGHNYETGTYVNQDIVKALEWYKRALYGGNIRSHYHLGDLALHGRGIIKQNLPFAIEHLETAAAEGVPLAYVSLGYAYEHGLGRNQSLLDAYFHYYVADQLGSKIGTQNKFRLAQRIRRKTRTKLEDRAQEKVDELNVKTEATKPLHERGVNVRLIKDLATGETLENLRKMEKNAGTLDPLEPEN